MEEEFEDQIKCFIEITEFKVPQRKRAAYKVEAGGKTSDILKAMSATLASIGTQMCEPAEYVEFLKTFTMNTLHNMTNESNITGASSEKEFYKLLKKLTETEEEE